MIIKSLEIQNFRSYYKTNVFNFCDGLNLIIGSNGDGKTTLFEALEWVFRTDDVVKTDVKFISKKRAEELFSGDSDNVSVSVTYEHNGSQKILEKKFRFTKAYNGDITTSNYEFNLITQDGVERDIKSGNRFEYDLPSELRKYSMFKGETNLDIFQSSNALKMLVDTFSDVKDFDAYFSFMEYATRKADQARENAQKTDRKNAAEIRSLTTQIDNLKMEISRKSRELKNAENEVENFTELLKNIEQSREASRLLIAVNDRITNLEKKRNETRARIHEDYTINLLDDMWILMGFEEIANEYTAIVSAADKERRKQENEHQQQIGVKKLLSKAETNFIPLPAHVPGPQIMQEMLDAEVCKVCGRPAEKGSDAWNFMLSKLNEYKDSLKVEDEEEDSLYENDYILELQKRDTILNDNLSNITKLRAKIEDAIAFYNRLHEDVKKLDANIERELEQKKRILAQTDGLTEEQLTANYENISNWMDKKHSAERSIETLKRQIAAGTANLKDCQEKLAKLAKGTSAEMYSNTWMILNKISEAFKNAKETNKKRLLMSIEDEANAYLDMLNIDDFKGTIRILMKAQGNAEAVLVDDDEARIYNPNTALRTTQFMSILFAISKLSAQKKEKKYPLIFDAPTSSFAAAKESEFFDVISKLDKQVIIVTKSFLVEDANGNTVVDKSKVQAVNGTVYRIEKMKPFDDKKLATIQTVISKL